MDHVRRRRRSYFGSSSSLTFDHPTDTCLISAGQRAAWLPYFENVNAIIFLAPISCFDERLAEVNLTPRSLSVVCFSCSAVLRNVQDPKINRLQDSFILWRSIVNSKLLAKTTMVVFLNKCDLLKRKLKSGVMVNKYLPSYGNRPNDLQTVVKCESKSV